MNVMDAINLLKKHDLYDKAQNECKRKKIDEVPYDMKGHHDIYCSCLSEERIKLRNNLEKFLKVKCFELDNISGNFAHDDCFFVGLYCTKEFCKTKCEYYQENLAALFQEIDELAEAEKVLTEASERGLV